MDHPERRLALGINWALAVLLRSGNLPAAVPRECLRFPGCNAAGCRSLLHHLGPLAMPCQQASAHTSSSLQSITLQTKARRWTLAGMETTDRVKPETLSTPKCTFIPKDHWKPFIPCASQDHAGPPCSWWNQGSDQHGAHGRSLLDHHATRTEMGVKDLRDMPTQIILFLKVSATKSRRLFRDSMADQIDLRKATHAGHLDQNLFHGRLTERAALMPKMDPQHQGQQARRTRTLFADLGAARLDQPD